MHMIKPDGPHRPGRSVFSWHDTEAKVNSQFPRITKAASYPSTGPPSRPIFQESVRRWEKAAWENSYIINHAAGFNRCSSELQDRMSQNISLLCSRVNKGKAPKEVSGTLNDLRGFSSASFCSHGHVSSAPRRQPFCASVKFDSP